MNKELLNQVREVFTRFGLRRIEPQQGNHEVVFCGKPIGVDDGEIFVGTEENPVWAKLEYISRNIPNFAIVLPPYNLCACDMFGDFYWYQSGNYRYLKDASKVIPALEAFLGLSPSK